MKEGSFFVLSCNRRKPSLVGCLIKRSIKGRVTHSALGFVRNGRIIIFESQKDGSNFKRYELWMKKFDYKFTAHLIPNVDPDFAFDTMLDYANFPYGKMDLVRHWIHGWSGIWLGLDKDHKQLICSESVLLILRDLGEYNEFIHPIAPMIHMANPNDVLGFCEFSGYPIIELP